MENYFSVSKAAELAGTTAETLRHYDRIGLVSPSRVDEWTGYRYYTADDIVRINTVRSLQSMDFSLAEIGKILKLENVDEIARILGRALASAEKKIDELRRARERILRAKSYYERKHGERHAHGEIYERQLAQRVILPLKEPMQATIENLTDYHRHFYAQVGRGLASAFEFEDVAGIYACGGTERMFAVCKSYADADGLVRLPEGRYICMRCAQNEREKANAELLARAEELCGAKPQFTVSLVQITGILNWAYEVQCPCPQAAADNRE